MSRVHISTYKVQYTRSHSVKSDNLFLVLAGQSSSLVLLRFHFIYVPCGPHFLQIGWSLVDFMIKMSMPVAIAILLASTLTLAGPVLVGREASYPPGSVLPTQTSYPPLGASDVPTTNSNGKFQWQVYGKCDDASKDAITQAWEDSRQFTDAFSKWKPKGDCQPAVDMYMGTRSTYEDLLGYNFPKQIQGESISLATQCTIFVLTALPDTISRMQGLCERRDVDNGLFIPKP